MGLRLSIELKLSKPILLVIGAVIIITAMVFFGYKLTVNKNPLPQNIKNQIKFSVIYPKKSSVLKVNENSLDYKQSDKILSFSGNANDNNIIFTEQPAPGDSSTPTTSYYQSLGLHPAAQIQTKLGLAVLVNFYKSGSYDLVGQSAILANNGTLLIAQGNKKLDNETWKSLFNEFSLYK